MTIKYIPLTDLELEERIYDRMSKLIMQIEDIPNDFLPDSLYKNLLATIEDYEWEEEVIKDDYDLYLDYVDDLRLEDY